MENKCSGTTRAHAPQTSGTKVATVSRAWTKTRSCGASWSGRRRNSRFGALAFAASRTTPCLEGAGQQRPQPHAIGECQQPVSRLPGRARCWTLITWQAITLKNELCRACLVLLQTNDLHWLASGLWVSNLSIREHQGSVCKPCFQKWCHLSIDSWMWKLRIPDMLSPGEG